MRHLYVFEGFDFFLRGLGLLGNGLYYFLRQYHPILGQLFYLGQYLLELGFSLVLLLFDLPLNLLPNIMQLVRFFLLVGLLDSKSFIGNESMVSFLLFLLSGAVVLVAVGTVLLNVELFGKFELLDQNLQSFDFSLFLF